MAKNIKEIFDKACSHLKIDNKLLRSIRLYEQAFLHKNPDHTQFFGGVTIGVQTVRFTSADKNEWVDGLIGVDENQVRNEVISLPSIDPSWVRATNIVNLSCCYLVHRIHNSDLSPKDKEQGMIDTLVVMQFRLFTSLLSHYYRYPVNEETAQAVYAALSKKYMIKKHGNWFSVLEQRARDIIDPGSIHAQTIKDFDDDAAIIYMVHDIQGRLKSMIKKSWRVLDAVRTQGAKILTVGGTIELDGKLIVKDVNRSYTVYRRYLQEIVLDKARFIKPELIDVIDSAMNTMPVEPLTKSLTYLCEQAVKRDKAVDKLLEEVLLHAITYINTDPDTREHLKDPGELIYRLRGLYMASRSSDPVVLELRAEGEKIVEKATGNKTAAMLAAVRTGMLLYICLRVFCRDYYS